MRSWRLEYMILSQDAMGYSTLHSSHGRVAIATRWGWRLLSRYRRRRRTLPPTRGHPLCLEPRPLPASRRPARARRHFRPLAQRILTRHSRLAVEAPPGPSGSHLLQLARGTQASSPSPSCRTRGGGASTRSGTAAGSASASTSVAPAPASRLAGAWPSPAPLPCATSLSKSRDYRFAAVPVD
jgi:hypothetical protein